MPHSTVWRCRACGRALVARNAVDLRHSDLRMHGRRVEAAIEQAEAEPERDWLGSIRARLFGDGAA